MVGKDGSNGKDGVDGAPGGDGKDGVDGVDGKSDADRGAWRAGRTEGSTVRPGRMARPERRAWTGLLGLRGPMHRLWS